MGTTADYGSAASPRSGATSLSAWAAAVHARFEVLVTDLAAKAAAARTITAGAGLTGGGSLAADRTLDVGAGTGISVGADAVALDLTWADGRYRTMARATFSNADATCAATTRYLGQIGTMSASRTVTLPAANAVPAGTEIIVADDSGTASTTNTIVIARAGSDTINGATSMTIAQAYGARKLYSNGSTKWSVDGGVLRASNNLADVSSAATTLANIGAAPASTVGNLLSESEAGCTVAPTGLQCAIVVDAVGRDGGPALKLTAASIQIGFGWRGWSNRGTMPITPGAMHTARVSAAAIAATPGASAMVRIYWWTASGTNSPASVPSASSTWVVLTSALQEISVTAVAPADARYASVWVGATGLAAGDTIAVAECGMWRGAGGDWSMPGVPIVNLGRLVTHPATDDVLCQTWDGVSLRWQTTWYDTGVRDVSSLLSNGWTATAVRLRRINTHVELVFTGLNGASATSGTVLTLPAGFRPPVALPTPIGDTASTVPNRVITANTSGTVVVGTGCTSVTSGSVRLEHNTSAARDASLPGTLISAAPYA